MWSAILGMVPAIAKVVLAGIAAFAAYGLRKRVGDRRELKLLKAKEKQRGKARERRRKVTERGRPSPAELRSRKRRGG